MGSKGFQDRFEILKHRVQENPDVRAWPDKMEVNFGDTGDTDLYYGIGKCEFVCAYTRTSSSVRVKFASKDICNFDEIRTIHWDKVKKLSLLNLA